MRRETTRAKHAPAKHAVARRGAGKPVGPRKSGSTVGRTPAKRKEYVLDTLAIVFGSAVFGAAVNIFTLGNQIVPGGATGVSIVANYLFGTPVGVVTIIVNIPLFLFALRKMGASFFIKTAVATVVSSLAIDLFAFLPHYTEDRLLATIFGGVMQGAGLSFIYMRGITTGGSDLLSALIRSKFNRLSLGHLLLLVDGAIVLLGSLVYRDVTSAFYSAIMIYISSTVIDAMLAGLEKSKFCFIISSKSEVIERRIIETLDRSATSFVGRGAYHGEEKNVILCAVKRFEMYRLQKLVSEVDPGAFIIFGNAAEVFGVGFTDLKT